MKIEESSIIETNDYRVIIYPASRSFSPKESKVITEKLYDFLATWAAHGKPLSSSFKVEKNQFIIVCVDEEKEEASGCSIDELGGVMREIDQQFDLGLLDRMKATFVENDEIKTLKLQDFKDNKALYVWNVKGFLFLLIKSVFLCIKCINAVQNSFYFILVSE